MYISSSSNGSSSINDDFILMRNLKGYESKWFHDPTSDVNGKLFLMAKIHKIAKKNRGGQ
jgi:hypothetical protein